MADERIKALARITGDEHAFAMDDTRAAHYRDLFGFIVDREPELVLAARPADTDALRACLDVARKYGLSVWQTPNGTGNGAVPGAAGRPGLLLDLQRMNRIIDVDGDSACALVEPGVSYRALHAHLSEKTIPLWIDCDRDADHSIAGSICSKQFGYTPYGDHLLMQCGTEVMLPDGLLVRTGMGALPGSDTWQLFKYNFGPYVDGLFMQSDLAVVTKVGLWLMPGPPQYFPFMCLLRDGAAMQAAVELMRDFRINNVIPNTVVVANAALESAPYSARADFVTDGQLDRARLRDVRGGDWILYGALYGGPDNVKLTWEAVSGALDTVDGAAVRVAADGADDPAWRDRQSLMRGTPIGREARFAVWGAPAAMRLTAAAPIEGTHADQMAALTGAAMSAHGMDSLIEFAITSRTLLMHVYIPYERNADSFGRAADCARALLPALAGGGYGIVDESIELRQLADNMFAGTALAGLASRIRAATAA